ncbi:MAG TPA: DsbA family protein, partial [Novosphingobium sp.]|nr:DsbA family protein [Novosphingobium sp.]
MTLRTTLVASIAGILAGFAGGALALSGVVPMPHGASDAMVHDYILSHPEILPEAIDKLRSADAAKQVGAVRAVAEKPWPGAVMGNPDGKVVLVEFMDFACGYCRQSLADVDRLVAANPDLKVVLRELPILSPASVDAAKMALAAGAQGKYGAFHHAMYDAGRPDAASIADAAKKAGIDMTRAATTIASPQAQAEIEGNLEMARKLGLNGTPSWIVGDRLLSGAVGYDALAQAIAAAR